MQEGHGRLGTLSFPEKIRNLSLWIKLTSETPCFSAMEDNQALVSHSEVTYSLWASVSLCTMVMIPLTS